MSAFGERLKNERLRLGLNQAELAIAGGVKRNAQINYEKDIRVPDINYMHSIECIGIDINYVITGKSTNYNTVDLQDDDFMEVLNLYKRAPLKVRAKILGLLASVEDEREEVKRSVVTDSVKNQSLKTAQLLHELPDATRREILESVLGNKPAGTTTYMKKIK